MWSTTTTVETTSQLSMHTIQLQANFGQKVGAGVEVTILSGRTPLYLPLSQCFIAKMPFCDVSIKSCHPL